MKEKTADEIMSIEDTYNIHKKINCIFPFFKSKIMCKKGTHNYIFKRGEELKWICMCCGKEIDVR